MADEDHFRPAIALGMRYDLWVTPQEIRVKQGLRKRTIDLTQVTHFGVKRQADARATLTELRLVTAVKVHKLPFQPGDAEAERVLKHLQELKPEADVSKLSWSEAAPLLKIKPYGFAYVAMQPMVAAGIILVLLSPVAVWIMDLIMPPEDAGEAAARPVALVICMVAGVVLAIIGYRRVKAEQRAEQEMLARRAAERE